MTLRLVEFDLLDLEDDPDGEVEFGTVNDLWTGEVVTAICPDGESTYWEHDRELIELKEAEGRTKYRPIDWIPTPGTAVHLYRC